MFGGGNISAGGCTDHFEKMYFDDIEEHSTTQYEDEMMHLNN